MYYYCCMKNYFIWLRYKRDHPIKAKFWDFIYRELPNVVWKFRYYVLEGNYEVQKKKKF